MNKCDGKCGGKCDTDTKPKTMSLSEFVWGDGGEVLDQEEKQDLLNEEIKEIIAEIQSFSQEEKAFDFSSSKQIYDYLKEHFTGAYISDQHVSDEDLGYTYYVIAKDKEAYDEYEKTILHQHNFSELYGKNANDYLNIRRKKIGMEGK